MAGRIAAKRLLTLGAAARVSSVARVAYRRALAVQSPSKSLSPFASPQVSSFHATAWRAALMPFQLADIGEGIVEVEVLQWFVNNGDKINEFDKICEVQSDKATVEITSRFSGIVRKLHYKVGDTAKVGKPLVDIEVADKAPPPGATQEQSPQKSAPPEVAPAIDRGHPIHAGSHATFATPAVRRLAKEHSLQLQAIKGTGRNGRILKEDILRHIGELPDADLKEPAPAPATPTPTPITAPVAAPVKSSSSTTTERREPIRGFKKAMVRTMNESWRKIPHFGYCDDIMMNNATTFRNQLREIAVSRGVKVSYMPILIKAASVALKQYPILNSSIKEDETELIYKASHNIGVAMDTPNGLIVPNIKDVQDRSILEIAAELNRLQDLGSRGQLSMADLSGGTFTLSNIGTIGGTYMKPIIVSPEVCIGAIGKIDTQPRFDKDGNIIKAQIMAVSWSADHRIIDGATMARFSTLWKSYIEKPQQLLLELK